ncbi:MAG: GNAT family N-acetyltransferase [Pseudomonadota bacterium]
MTTSYTARLLTPEDLDIWRRLRREGVTRFPNAFLLDQEEVANTPEERDRSVLAAKVLFGVFCEDKAVGIAGLRMGFFNQNKHRAHMGPFYVDPDHWGMAAAQTLLDTLIQTAQDRGATQIELEVDAENPRAIAFYKKVGFQQIGRMPNAMHREGAFHDDLLMVRPIEAT